MIPATNAVMQMAPPLTFLAFSLLSCAASPSCPSEESLSSKVTQESLTQEPKLSLLEIKSPSTQARSLTDHFLELATELSRCKENSWKQTKERALEELKLFDYAPLDHFPSNKSPATSCRLRLFLLLAMTSPEKKPLASALLREPHPPSRRAIKEIAPSLPELLLESASSPLGYVLLLEPLSNKDFVVLYGLYLDPSLRGQGLGKRAVNYLLERAQEEGFACMTLQVHLHNEGARHLYKSCGFKTYRRKPAEDEEMQKEINQGAPTLLMVHHFSKKPKKLLSTIGWVEHPVQC